MKRVKTMEVSPPTVSMTELRAYRQQTGCSLAEACTALDWRGTTIRQVPALLRRGSA